MEGLAHPLNPQHIFIKGMTDKHFITTNIFSLFQTFIFFGHLTALNKPGHDLVKEEQIHYFLQHFDHF